ncbi:MAG: cell division FtsA domain-containing protein [Sarcina sp.]
MNENIVALGIGSKYLSATMSKFELGERKIVASVVVNSKGIEKGKIIDKTLFKQAIEEIITKLKGVTKEKIENIYISLGTEDIRIEDSKGSCNLDKNKPIEKEQIDRAYLDGKEINIEEDECIVDGIIKSFYTAESGYIENPLGLKSKELELELTVIVAKKALVLALKEIFIELEIEINGFILSIEAINNFVVKSEEMQNKNNVLIDFGAEKIEIGIFKRNKLKAVDFIALGAKNITTDIAIVTNIAENVAEEIKIKNSPNFIKMRNDFAKIEIANGLKVESTLFYEVIMARLEEIIDYIKKSLETTVNYDKIDNVIIVGEGIVNFEKVAAIFSEYLNKNVKIIEKKDLNIENYSIIMSNAIVKEVHHRLKLLYKKDVFSIMLQTNGKETFSKNTIFKEKNIKGNKGKLSKVLGLLGDIF